MNMDLLKTNSHHNIGDYFDSLLSYGFLPSTTRPTRVTDYTSTLIDNIFFNCSELSYSSYIIYDDISDHFPTYLEIDIKSCTRDPEVILAKRSYKTCNYDVFYNSLKLVDWNDIFVNCSDNADPDLMYNDFFNIFSSIFNDS